MSTALAKLESALPQEVRPLLRSSNPELLRKVRDVVKDDRELLRIYRNHLESNIDRSLQQTYVDWVQSRGIDSPGAMKASIARGAITKLISETDELLKPDWDAKSQERVERNGREVHCGGEVSMVGRGHGSTVLLRCHNGHLTKRDYYELQKEVNASRGDEYGFWVEEQIDNAKQTEPFDYRLRVNCNHVDVLPKWVRAPNQTQTVHTDYLERQAARMPNRSRRCDAGLIELRVFSVREASAVVVSSKKTGMLQKLVGLL